MHRRDNYLASLFLSAALAAPLGVNALAVPQDDRDHERHEQEEREHRVYDPQYKDYHNWDQREDETYRHWLAERRREYVDINRLDAGEQRAYWKWRHAQEKHEEHEEHEHH
jgi:hypothetical protein